MLIDTHCHLDAPEFDRDRENIVEQALHTGVQAIVIPAVMRGNFAAVQALQARYPTCCAMALGIHPLYVEQSAPEDIVLLADAIASQRDTVLAV